MYKNILDLTVKEMLHLMTDEEVGKLYTALLRIDEVNLLGTAVLKDLWTAVKAECEER